MIPGLLPHQLAAAQLIAERGRAYLADPPGMAKTRAAIAALEIAGCKRKLVIAPSIVRSHWGREHEALNLDPNDSVIMSYDNAVRGGVQRMAELIHREKVDGLIIDEAHYCKHFNSQRTRIVLGRDGYARRVRRVIPISGTPLPRNPAEIWTVMASVFPEIVREYGITTADKWNSTFCVARPMVVRGQYREKVVGMKNADLLREILSRVLIRRSFTEVGFSLPAVWWQTLRLDGTQGALGEFEETAGRVRVAIEEGKLAEIANDPHVASMRRRIGELKVGPIVETLRSQLADSEEKVVVFAYHRSVLGSLRESLHSFGVAYIDGDTVRRDEEIDRFRTDPNCRVFVGQSVACQTGLDGLQHAARRAIILEPGWTPDENTQLAARIARMGQKGEGCVVQLVSLSGTLDEAVIAQVKRETEIVAEAMDFGQAGSENE